MPAPPGVTHATRRGHQTRKITRREDQCKRGDPSTRQCQSARIYGVVKRQARGAFLRSRMTRAASLNWGFVRNQVN